MATRPDFCWPTLAVESEAAAEHLVYVLYLKGDMVKACFSFLGMNEKQIVMVALLGVTKKYAAATGIAVGHGKSEPLAIERFGRFDVRN